MNRIKSAILRWKMRRVVMALAMRVSARKGEEDGVFRFAKMLEATHTMSKGLKRDDEMTFQCTRDELDQFIRYMTTLHDSRLALLVRARIGLATLAMKDKHVLAEEPKEVLEQEFAKTVKGKELNIVDPAGKKIKVRA